MTAIARATTMARRVARPGAPAPTRYLRRARVRLTLWYVGVLLVLLVAVGITVYLVLAQVLKAEMDSDLRAAAATFANPDAVALRQALTPARPKLPNAAPPLTDDAQGQYDPAYSDVFVLTLDTHGIIQSNPRGVSIDRLPDAAGVVAASAGRVDLRTISRNGQQYRLLTRPIQSGGQIAGIVQVGKSMRPYERNLHATVLALAGGGLTALVLAAAGGWLVAGRALRPVQVGWQRQQAFVADASHELRTPLSILRADAEVMLRTPSRTVEENRDLVEDIIGVTDNLSTLVTDMLTLTRLDAGRLPLNKGEFDARELLDEVSEQTRRLLDGRELRLTVSGPAGIALLADRDRVRQVLRILLDNALRHTPDGGTITLSAHLDAGRACLVIRDTGSGIAPEHLPHVFERFYRADQARSRADGGAGLGLAIARGIVEAHGGRLQIASHVGRDTTVTVDLPATRT